MKSYTDIEQSKALSKILPLESADMLYYCSKESNTLISESPFTRSFKETNTFSYIPCWSLAALLGVLPDYTLQTNTNGTVFVVCESKKPMMSDAYENPVDACYEMIIRLHELKMLRL